MKVAKEIWRHIEIQDNWKIFKKAIKNSKWELFNNKIHEISNKRKEPWKLMNWVKKRKLPAIEAIKYNGHLYLKIEDLWQALHKLFNSAQHWQVDVLLLEEILTTL